MLIKLLLMGNHLSSLILKEARKITDHVSSLMQVVKTGGEIYLCHMKFHPQKLDFIYFFSLLHYIFNLNYNLILNLQLNSNEKAAC